MRGRGAAVIRLWFGVVAGAPSWLPFRCGWRFSPLLLALLSTPSWAQPGLEGESISPSELREMDIEQLMQVQVSTISRAGERLDLAPGSIYVYSREVIRRRGYRSLGELLQTVPGFTVFHRDTQFVVGIRGLNANDNDKMSLLINGQRVIGLHEQELLNGPINLDNVERVEVVVGPSSLFQQADTLAATVNLIIRPSDGLELDLATGTALPYSGTLNLGKTWSPQRSAGFSFTTERKRGFDAWTNPSRPYLPGRDLTGRLQWPNYFGVLLGRYDDWSAQAVAYRSDWPELWIDGADLANDGTYSERFHSAQLKFDHSLAGRLRSVLSAEVAHKAQIRSNEGGPPINATSQSIKQLQYKADASLRYSDPDGHNVQAGVQASFDDNFDTFFTFDDTSAGNNVHIPQTPIVTRNTYALGFYLDDELQLSTQLKLVAGVRVDHNTRVKTGKWYPAWRSAVVFQPFKNWVTKAVFYRSVRMPSSFEALNQVFGTNNPDGPTKPAFANLSPTADRPETLTTFEWHNILYIGRLRLAAAVFHQKLNDFITWFQPHSNGGNFEGNGAEVNGQMSLDSLTIWGNGAWNDSRLHLFRPEVFGPVSNTPENVHTYVNNDGRIIGSVQYTANLGFDSQLFKNLRLSPSLRYFTNQAAFEFRVPAECGAYQRTLRNRVYFDATLGWHDIKLGSDSALDLRLSVANILNDRRPVAAQLFGDTYRPRGISAVLAADLRF
jgi:outer membrane cobalamin receptor